MASGNETEVLTENAQPVAAVVANTEISEATPQAEPTEQLEVYIEEDTGDQKEPKNEMSQAQAYAAFQKEKRKRKDKQSELDSKDNEIAAMQKTVSELQSQVGNITRGEMPDPSIIKKIIMQLLKSGKAQVKQKHQLSKSQPSSKQTTR